MKKFYSCYKNVLHSQINKLPGQDMQRYQKAAKRICAKHTFNFLDYTSSKTQLHKIHQTLMHLLRCATKSKAEILPIPNIVC